jgi:low temperature requirement protein LtrA
MSAVIGMAVHATYAFDPNPAHNTAFYFLIAYVCSMGLDIGIVLITAWFNPEFKFHLLLTTGIKVFPMIVYILASLEMAQTNFSAGTSLWSIAVLMDVSVFCSSGVISQILPFWQHPTVGINVEHLTERFGLIIIVVLGEIVMAILIDNNLSLYGLSHVALQFGLLIAFCLQFTYFRVEASPHYLHAMQRSYWVCFRYFTFAIRKQGAQMVCGVE